MNQDKISILIEGATGTMGSLITKHALLRSNLLVNILVRNPEKNKPLVEQVEKAGGKVIKADLGDIKSLEDVTKGIHTVISTISNFDEKVAVDGELALLNDAIKNGVKRFAHSRFGCDYDYLPEEDKTFFMNWKDLIQDKVRKSPVASIDIYNGVFVETYLHLMSDGGIRYAGDINAKIDLSTYEDVAKYTVAVVSNPELSGRFDFVSQKVSTAEIADAYNRIRGANIKPKRLGSVEELKKIKDEETKQKGGAAWMIQLEYMFATGLAWLPKVSNSQFPELTPETLDHMITRNANVSLE